MGYDDWTDCMNSVRCKSETVSVSAAVGEASIARSVHQVASRLDRGLRRETSSAALCCDEALCCNEPAHCRGCCLLNCERFCVEPTIAVACGTCSNAAGRSAPAACASVTQGRGRERAQVVYNPADAEVFLPRLLPVLDVASSSVADPEVRAVVAVAHKGLDDLHAAAISGANAQARPAAPPFASAASRRRLESREDGAGCALSHSLVGVISDMICSLTFILVAPLIGDAWCVSISPTSCLRLPPPTNAAAAQRVWRGRRAQAPVTMDEAAVGRVLREVAEQASGAAPAASSAPVLNHIVKLVSPLLAAANFEEDVWDQVRSRCPPSVPPLRTEVGRYFAQEMGRCA